VTANIVLQSNNGTLPRRRSCAQAGKIDRHLEIWRARDEQQQERNNRIELRDFERDFGIGFQHG
jgi:hypothetical protein